MCVLSISSFGGLTGLFYRWSSVLTCLVGVPLLLVESTPPGRIRYRTVHEKSGTRQFPPVSRRQPYMVRRLGNDDHILNQVSLHSFKLIKLHAQLLPLQYSNQLCLSLLGRLQTHIYTNISAVSAFYDIHVGKLHLGSHLLYSSIEDIKTDVHT